MELSHLEIYEEVPLNIIKLGSKCMNDSLVICTVDLIMDYAKCLIECLKMWILYGSAEEISIFILMRILSYLE